MARTRFGRLRSSTTRAKPVVEKKKTRKVRARKNKSPADRCKEVIDACKKYFDLDIQGDKLEDEYQSLSDQLRRVIYTGDNLKSARLIQRMSAISREIDRVTKDAQMAKEQCIIQGGKNEQLCVLPKVVTPKWVGTAQKLTNTNTKTRVKVNSVNTNVLRKVAKNVGVNTTVKRNLTKEELKNKLEKVRDRNIRASLSMNNLQQMARRLRVNVTKNVPKNRNQLLASITKSANKNALQRELNRFARLQKLEKKTSNQAVALANRKQKANEISRNKMKQDMKTTIERMKKHGVFVGIENLKNHPEKLNYYKNLINKKNKIEQNRRLAIKSVRPTTKTQIPNAMKERMKKYGMSTGIENLEKHPEKMSYYKDRMNKINQAEKKRQQQLKAYANRYKRMSPTAKAQENRKYKAWKNRQNKAYVKDQVSDMMARLVRAGERREQREKNKQYIKDEVSGIMRRLTKPNRVKKRLQ